MRRRERGGTLVESAVVTTVFLTLLISVMQFSMIGFAYNLVCFAAHRAARFATVHGNSSGHVASVSDVQTIALSHIACLNPALLTVTVTWTPDKNPGSKVQVAVAYQLTPFFIPVSAVPMTVQSTSKQIIFQ